MRQKKIITMVLWAAIIVAALVVGKISGILRPIEWLSQRIISPFQAATYRAGVSWFGGEEEASREALEDQNQTLKDQVNNLLVENTRLHTTVDELNELKLQLDKIAAVDAQAVPTKVIGRGIGGDQHTVEINAGQDADLVKGAVVLSEDGVVVGVITRVDAATSIVTLITSPATAIAAQVENVTRSPGVITGEHGLGLRMTLIPQTDTVTPNEVVVTSGSDEHVPEQLVIGTLATVTSTPGGLFQEATVTPLFDPNTVRLLTVVLK